MADFDGDGQMDLYTGSYEGGLYVLRGKGKGEFSAPAKLLDKSGAVLRLGKYWDDVKKWTSSETAKFPEELGIAGAAVDWDADGDLDLVLGSQSGRMFLRRNLGSAKAHAYSLDDVPILANGEELMVESGHAMPQVADWDGDGAWDLISGSDSGAVHWWRNAGKKGEPKFEKPVELVGKSSKKDDAPGERTQASVCDFDADGRLDLLVGDYRSSQKEDGKTAFRGYVWLYRRMAAP